MELLLKKIKQRQYKYYQYAIQCIDAYIDDDNIDPLRRYLTHLLKLEKGRVALGEDFNILVDAFKMHDKPVLQFIRYKFDIECKNEINTCKQV